MLKNSQNNALAYAQLVNSMRLFPALCKMVCEKIYKRYTLECYERAKRHPLYSDNYICGGKLETEVLHKQLLGAVLLADDNEEAKETLKKIFKAVFPDAYKGIKNKNDNQIKSFISKGRKESEISNQYGVYEAYIVLVHYIAYLLHEDNVNSEYLTKVQKVFEKLLEERANYSDEEIEQRGRNIIQEYGAVSSDVKEFEQHFNSVNVVGQLYDVITLRDTVEFQSTKKYIDDLRKKEKYSGKVIKKLLAVQMIASLINDQEGLSTILTMDKVYGKKERSLLNAIINIAMKQSGIGTITDADFLIWYTMALIFQNYANLYNDAKKFYFKNNNETQTIEIRSLEKRVQEEQQKREECEKYIETLERRLQSIHLEQKRAIKATTENLERIVRIKQARIVELEKKLEIASENVEELAKLREFVFESKEKFEPVEYKKSLGEVIEGKKIVVIGGTDSWRNKIQNKYPQVVTYSGVTKSVDPDVVAGADFVFLMTGYMAHTVYDKIIERMRKEHILFDYIGRTNSELLEQEMLEKIYTAEKRGEWNL